MKKKSVITMGFVAVVVTFALCGLAYGGEVGNFRFGANVKVAPEEVVSGGLAVAGANVEVLGTIEGGLKAFGANVAIPGAVQGAVNVLGANVILSGQYDSTVKAAGSTLTLSGTFEGDVEASGARITVARSAVIKGNLIYTAADLNIQKGSQLTGEVIQRQIMVKQEEVEKWGRRGVLAIIPLWVLFWLVSLASLVIVGVIINYLLFPQKTNAIIDSISKSPWKNLWHGFIFLVVVPVAIVIAGFTIVGIPAGIIAGLLYGIALYISRIYIGVWIGRKLLGYIKKSMAEAFFWPLVVGSIIIGLISIIPVAGWLFRLFVLLITLGAMWSVLGKAIPVPVRKKTARKSQKKSKKR